MPMTLSFGLEAINSLEINHRITESVLFSRKYNTEYFKSFILDGVELLPFPETKYFVVTLDQKIYWNGNVEEIYCCSTKYVYNYSYPNTYVWMSCMV